MSIKENYHWLNQYSSTQTTIKSNFQGKINNITNNNNNINKALVITSKPKLAIRKIKTHSKMGDGCQSI